MNTKLGEHISCPVSSKRGRRWHFEKFLTMWLIFLAGVTGSFGQESLDDCLFHYQQGRFPKAREISRGLLHEPLGRMVYALCQIHDEEHQELAAGLGGLEKIYGDGDVVLSLRLEAQLSYTRVVQLLQARGRHKAFDSIDIEALYLDLIEKGGKDERVCQAALHLAESYFEAYLFEPSQADARKGFDFLETFIENYQGDEENLTYVHLYIERFYVDILEDYAKSFAHLERAYQLGIAVIMTQRECLYKLGRMSDIKLGHMADAEKYYREFLELYPNAEQTPLIERYLQELGEKKK